MQTEREFTTPVVRPLSHAPTAHPAPEVYGEQRFAALQQRMAFVDAAARRRRSGRSLVVVPSRTPERWDEPPAKTQAYEERLLCVVQMLVDEGLSIVYVTSSPVATSTVDYYLSLLPARQRWSARRRLTMLSACDTSPCSLSAKVLALPSLVAQIRAALPVHGLAQLVPYDTTTAERDLALALDIPMYGADPRHRHLGTKTGSRELFACARVPHPVGVERVVSVAEVNAAIARIREQRPGLEQVVVKLNEGVTGRGNAIVDLRGRVPVWTLEAEDLDLDSYLAKLAEIGGIVEERITSAELRSPSVQLNITPLGEVEVVSTHDQLLGGPSGQSYLGCVYPAAPEYAQQITELAERVGGELARIGVIGRCAIDFVVARDRGAWRPYAIELNLRKGGTTHPFLSADLLTGGTFRNYVASDHIEVDGLCGGTAVATLARHGLSFDPERRSGVVLHMLGAAESLGRIGATAMAPTAVEARRLYDAAAGLLVGGAAANVA